MEIRQFKESDIDQLVKIHDQFYKEEFSFIDFCHSFIDFFVVEENEKIITAGGIRVLAESVIITDKSYPTKTRVRALRQMLDAQLFACKFNQLHAFIINEPEWENQLKKIGFKATKGNALVIEVNNG